MSKQLSRLLPAALLIAFSLTAQTLPQGVERTASIEGITEYRLANGLKVLLFPDPSKATMTVNMTYLVGSLQEGSGERGMAHLLEHMVFKGSPKHPNIPQELTEHGTRPNGTTSYDRTNYFETFSATDTNLEWALDLESDRMVNSFIRKSDLESEFTVVRNEFESGENSPTRVLQQRLLSTAYLWHPYGQAVIGNRTDLENVPIDKLQAFYKKFYQPDNAVLTISGKMDEAKLLPLVAKYFSPIPRPARKLDQNYTVEPAQDGERVVALRRVGDIQALYAGYHIPAGSDPDFPAIDVLMTILGDNPSGRLHRALVDDKKAAQALAGTLQLNDPGIAIVGAILNKTDSMDEARRVLLATIDNIVKEPPTKAEVDRARTRLLSEIDLQLRNSESIGLNISNWASQGDWRLLFLFRDRLRNVTPEDVQRVAKAYLKPSNRTLAELYPEAAPDRSAIPAKQDLAAVLKDYKGDAAMAQGEVFDPSPANIEARVKRLRLANGMKVSLMPLKTRGNTVSATVRLHFGNVDRLRNLDVVSGLSMSLLMRGTKSKSRQQIQDELDRLKARGGAGGGGATATAQIQTVRDSLPAALRLMAEVLREPSFPESEFEQIRKLQLTSIDNAKTEPQTLGSLEFQRALNPYPRGDIRSAMSLEETVEDLQKVTLDQIRKFHADFVGASNAELSIAGDFDSAGMEKLAAELFGTWRSPGAYQRVPRDYQKIAATTKVIKTPDKQNAVFLAGQNLNLSDSDPDYPALILGNYMLGGGFLNSRLATRIRQKDGLSYGISSGLSAAALDKNGTFQIQAIAAPQNVEKVEAAAKEEIARALKDGFTPEEVAAAKSGWLQSRTVGRSSETAMAATLAGHDFNERNMTFDAGMEAKVGALTPAQIREALARHIDPAAWVIVKAGDFK
jgi:zinc protease